MFSITSVLISSAIWCLSRGGKGKGSEGGRGRERETRREREGEGDTEGGRGRHGGKEGDIGGGQPWMYTAVSWWYVHSVV